MENIIPSSFSHYSSTFQLTTNLLFISCTWLKYHGRAQWDLFPVPSPSAAHRHLCHELSLAPPCNLEATKELLVCSAACTTFLLISRIFQAMFTCFFLAIIKTAFIIHLTSLWCTHEIDSPSLHSCGIFPKHTRFNSTINLNQNPRERTEQYCCNLGASRELICEAKHCCLPSGPLPLPSQAREDACPTPCALLCPPGRAPAALASVLREEEPGMYPEQEDSHRAGTERMQDAPLFSLLS